MLVLPVVEAGGGGVVDGGGGGVVGEVGGGVAVPVFETVITLLDAVVVKVLPMKYRNS